MSNFNLQNIPSILHATLGEFADDLARKADRLHYDDTWPELFTDFHARLSRVAGLLGTAERLLWTADGEQAFNDYEPFDMARNAFSSQHPNTSYMTVLNDGGKYAFYFQTADKVKQVTMGCISKVNEDNKLFLTWNETKRVGFSHFMGPHQFVPGYVFLFIQKAQATLESEYGVKA